MSDVITARSLADDMAFTVIIHVRFANGTHLARAHGLGITASATSGWQDAAERCAAKVAKGRKFTLIKSVDCLYRAEIQERP